MVSSLNTNLASLQVIVASLQDGDYLMSVSPFMENGEQVGWMLQFAKSGIVVIYSGFDGKDGVTPTFKIGDGWWFVSYDEGASWTKMDKAVGDGSFIDSIDFSDESFVTLILSDGTSMPIPRFQPSDFVLDVPEEGFPIQAGEVRTIPFSISGSSPGSAVITAASDGYYRPQVSMTGPAEGVIYVTAPSPYGDGYIVLMLDNGNGYSTMQVVRFCQRSVRLSGGADFKMDENGGTITIPWESNFIFTVSTDADWIHIVEAKASLSGQIILSVDPNPEEKPRSGVIKLYPEDNPTFVSQEIFISEAAKEAEIIIPELHSMILTVRASYENGFIVYLPLRGRLRCKVDWGDGASDIYDVNNAKDWIWHRYDVSEPTSYLVTVSGEVGSLNANGIPQKFGIISVDHWGNLNTQEVSYAFSHLTSLKSVASDTEGFFSGVIKCYGIFAGCTGLTDLSDDLFLSGDSICSFDEAFMGCSSLKNLPPALFRGCGSVGSFEATFAYCNSLESVPEDLFSYSPRAQSFNITFDSCTNLKSIPEGLFSQSPDAKSFGNTFFSCSIETIPEKLFAGCPNVTNFGGTFEKCYALQSIPAGVFDNNRRVTDFGGTFAECWNLKCESPYSILDGKKVHLYERLYYPEFFAVPTSSTAAGDSLSQTWRLLSPPGGGIKK